jgi:hypothetical protein
MNDNDQRILLIGICRPDGAWPVGGGLATKIPLLTELVGGMYDLKTSKVEFFEK